MPRQNEHAEPVSSHTSSPLLAKPALSVSKGRGAGGEVTPRPGWGGRRPGAGAPKRNLNHLRHDIDPATITRAAAIISLLPDVHRLFQAICTTTDKDRYNRLLARTPQNLGKWQPLRDSIKTDVAVALMLRLDQIQEMEEFFSRRKKRSRQSSSSAVERFYESIARTDPDLYNRWFKGRMHTYEDDHGK